jgi:hypothetical protein
MEAGTAADCGKLHLAGNRFQPSDQCDMSAPNPNHLVEIPFTQTIPKVSWYRHESWEPGKYKRFEHCHTMSQNLKGYKFFNEINRQARAADMLREHGFTLINSCAGPSYAAQSRIEFWGKAGFVLLLQCWADGGCSCYMSDGNPTWEEWGNMLDGIMSTPADAVQAQAARIRDLVSENVKLRAACERADHLVKEMEMAFDDVPAGVDAHLAMTRTALKAALATTANKPNANLIASAPELLEALRDVANDYETAGCDGCGTISERAMRVVLTAIAKAEGVTT